MHVMSRENAEQELKKNRLNIKDLIEFGFKVKGQRFRIYFALSHIPARIKMRSIDVILQFGRI